MCPSSPIVEDGERVPAHLDQESSVHFFKKGTAKFSPYSDQSDSKRDPQKTRRFVSPFGARVGLPPVDFHADTADGAFAFSYLFIILLWGPLAKLLS